MSRLVTEHHIAEAIGEILPMRIAVAFLGADWQKYLIDLQSVESIVISPTLGSNPKAILQLSKEIGWEKIHFLDELHAKVYIGKKSALIGSANLTANGLAGNSLVEYGVVLSSDDDLRSINRFFDSVVSRAAERYPDQDAKLSRVAELQILWNKAFSRNIINDEYLSRTKIKDFLLTSPDAIYVLWYMNGEYEYSKEVEGIQSLISDVIDLHPDDSPKPNQFVLTWKKNLRNTPDRRTKPRWMYIHEVFDNGVIKKGYEYTTLAIQRSDLKIPPVPFDLDADVVAKLFDLLSSGEFDDSLIQGETGFRLAKTIDGSERLIKKLKA